MGSINTPTKKENFLKIFLKRGDSTIRNHRSVGYLINKPAIDPRSIDFSQISELKLNAINSKLPNFSALSAVLQT